MSIISDAIKADGITFKLYPSEDPNNPPFGGGLAVMVGDKPAILLADGVPLTRQRSVAAHELGHILLGHVDTDAGSRRAPEHNPEARRRTIEKRELEADLFCGGHGSLCLRYGASGGEAEGLAA